MPRPAALLLALLLAPAVAHAQDGPPAPGMPRIHIETDNPDVTLREVTSVSEDGRRFTSMPVCQAPCDRVVDARLGQDFFFAGKGVVLSERFRLDHKRGDVSVAVRPGSVDRQDLGGVTLMAGLMCTFINLPFLILGAASPREQSFLPPTLMVGIVGTTIGLGTTAGGLVILSRSQTEYSFTTSTLRSFLTTGVVRF